MTDYERIRRSCLKRGELWEDPEFPATQASVFYHQTPPFQFVWKRPKVRKNQLLVFVFFKEGKFGCIVSERESFRILLQGPVLLLSFFLLLLFFKILAFAIFYLQFCY